MKIYSGKSVLEGIALGKLYLLRKQECLMYPLYAADAQKENMRLKEASETVKAELEQLYRLALLQTQQPQAEIFPALKLVLDDEAYLSCIQRKIQKGISAEAAVHETGNELSEQFAALQDSYFAARAADIQDVSQRLLRALTGNAVQAVELTEPVILVADDLTPGETLHLDKSKILAFVTKKGAVNSHTSILARALNIPALVGTDFLWEELRDGMTAAVDGTEGQMIVSPDEQTLSEMEQKRQALWQEQESVKELVGKENITSDGRKIEVLANIGSLKELENALRFDAGGIGLFRTEFLYMEREAYPTEQVQFEIYREVLGRMNGKKVVIRTLDIGSDKRASYFELPEEENPAMGYRAIRICLDREEMFKTQLRAIYRASVYGNAAILFPMITSEEEIIKIRQITEAVKQELDMQNIPYAKVELGIMIETPAAALISDILAQKVDFFSIGTNDLTQYTLAVDRLNPQLEKYYDARHPAVLRMIRMTVENGHKAGISVGICGELAADLKLTQTFMEMGVDSLSVSPLYVLKLRRSIRSM